MAEPGPGSYDVPLSTMKIAKKNYNSPTLRSKKAQNVIQSNLKSNSPFTLSYIPGPGQYDISNKFITSKYQSFGNVKLAPQLLSNIHSFTLLSKFLYF